MLLLFNQRVVQLGADTSTPTTRTLAVVARGRTKVAVSASKVKAVA